MSIKHSREAERQGTNSPGNLSPEDEARLNRLRDFADEAFAELDQGLGTELTGREQLEALLETLSPVVDTDSHSAHG